jgi:hypothetical protein
LRLNRKYRGDTSGSNYFQTAQAKLIHCFRTRFGFIFGVDSDLSRQSAELVIDVPTMIGAFRARVRSNAYLTIEEIDEEGKPTGRFLMGMVRSSLGPKLPTLAYRLEQREVGKDHRGKRTIIGSYVVGKTAWSI